MPEQTKKPKIPSAPTENAIEEAIDKLVSFDRYDTKKRSAILVLIKESLPLPGGVNVAWLLLGRNRPKWGADAGLKVLVEMCEAVPLDDNKPPKLDRAGIEPAVQLLAFFCNMKDYAKTICKMKGIMLILMKILQDWECSHTARISASWVLRRCTEFNRDIRFELANQKDWVLLLTRIMMSQDLRPQEDPQVLSIDESSAQSRTAAAKKTAKAAGNSRNASPMPDAAPKVPGGPTTATAKDSRTGPGPGEQPSRSANAMTMASGKASRPGTAVRYDDSSRPGTASMSRPVTASRRPGTSMTSFTDTRPGTSGTIFSLTHHIRPDVMCIEANCCAAIGNSALRDDCVDKLGKYEGLMMTVIHLLENGSYLAQGHAARTLGNLLGSGTPSNLKHLLHVDHLNTAADVLASMLMDEDTPMSGRKYALHAIGNMVRLSAFCDVFGRIDGLQSCLLGLHDQGVSEADRIISILSQHRLGTRTWRPATQIIG